MSYILEALKKFEQKREQKDLSKSMSFLGGPGPETGKRPLWPYLLVAALFLNAGILFWWIAPWRSEKKETSAPKAPLQFSQTSKPKVIEQNPLRGDRTLKETPPSGEAPTSPKPQAEKVPPPGPRSVSAKTREVDRINGVIPFQEKEPAKTALPPSRPLTPKSALKKSEVPVAKKVIYFKDGHKELCDEIRVTENFIHCTTIDGGAVINLNKIDLGKTLPGQEP
jgi:cytoskeletal protein RodZ